MAPQDCELWRAGAKSSCSQLGDPSSAQALAHSGHPVILGVCSVPGSWSGSSGRLQSGGEPWGPCRKQWVAKSSSSPGASLARPRVHAGQVYPTPPPPLGWLLCLPGGPTGGPTGPIPFLGLALVGSVLSQQSLPWTSGSTVGGVPFSRLTALKEETLGYGAGRGEREERGQEGCPSPAHPGICSGGKGGG